MANSSCPPFIGAPWGRNATEKANCTLRINQILETLKTIDGLKTVIMFSRGPSYWTGSEPSRLNRENPTIEIDAYFEGLQKSLHYIRNLGVRVLYVTENPELKYQPRSCLPRPFSQKNSQKCEQSLADVRERQSEYLDRLSALDSIVVIDSTKAFCRETDQTCYAVNDQNDLLYADDDHLSIKGSFWQYNRVIRPFFE